MLPTFFVIGAQKAGTTSLWAFLKEHPDVFVPPMKETNFLFPHPGALDRGLAWYESLYELAGPAARRGDFSPGYTMFPQFRAVPERAAALVPDARIVYMIRHPVERMVSAWRQTATDGHEHRALDEAILWDSHYFLASCYGFQLHRWAKAFPPESLLVVRAEDFTEDPGRVIDKVLVHLGLPAGWRPSDPKARHNRSGDKLVARARVRRVSGGLRGAGFERAAIAIAKSRPLYERLRLSRPLTPTELSPSPDRSAALMECFQEDFGLLRKLVGPELDLYGLA